MKQKILVAGIGGVGGFIGAKLSKYAEQHGELEVYFLCRGTNLDQIQKNGLELIEPSGSMVVKPYLASENCLGFPVMDVVILACKSYDLENMCKNISTCIGKNTIVMPLLNGIKHGDFLQQRFPEALISSAFIYIVSKLESAAKILMESQSHSLYFGNNKEHKTDFKKLEELLQLAQINANCVDNIDDYIWRKFTFISPIATFTSAYNLTKKEIISDEAYVYILREMMKEVIQLSQALNINLPADILELHWAQFSNLPDGSSSSMHRDYLLGKPSEIETLSEFVLIQSNRLGLKTPFYESVIVKLKTQTY